MSVLSELSTPLGRVKWTINFFLSDLRHLRPGDILNLRGELQRFLNYDNKSFTPSDVGGFVATIRKAPYPHEFAAEDFQSLRRQLDFFLADRLVSTSYGRNEQVTRGEWRCQVKVEINDWMLPMVTGTTVDTFLYRLYHDLETVGVDRLRTCDHCKRIYFKFGRKNYCSRQCANRENYLRRLEREGK